MRAIDIHAHLTPGASNESSGRQNLAWHDQCRRELFNP